MIDNCFSLLKSSSITFTHLFFNTSTHCLHLLSFFTSFLCCCFNFLSSLRFSTKSLRYSIDLFLPLASFFLLLSGFCIHLNLPIPRRQVQHRKYLAPPSASKESSIRSKFASASRAATVLLHGRKGGNLPSSTALLFCQSHDGQIHPYESIPLY